MIELIQGGMGVGVSNWRLAKAVAKEGQKLNENVLGVVSGTGLSPILTSRIRAGDTNTLRALFRFSPRIARDLMAEYIPGSQKIPPKPEVFVTGSEVIRQKTANTAIAAAFVEVALAKEGHDGPIGINILEKTQLSNIFTILGAMLADVDYVLVGAGIPYQIPEILNNFANHDAATYKVDIAGSSEKINITIDPKDYIAEGKILKRPQFLLIASQHILPMRLDADGFIIEGSSAGGHNAPARSKMVDDDGQPIYTAKDAADLVKLAALGRPFWLAGSYGNPDKLIEAQGLGATGVQVGSAFALCAESGLETSVKLELLKKIKDGTLEIKTSTVASPSGYPFQVAQLEGTLSENKVFKDRIRICNFGHLVEAYIGADGEIGFRCPAEPVDAYVKKGGDPKNTEGKVCLCNGLGATAGYGLMTANGPEPMIVTLGKDLSFAQRLNVGPDGMYSAANVVRYMFGK